MSIIPISQTETYTRGLVNFFLINTHSFPIKRRPREKRKQMRIKLMKQN